MKKIRCYKIDTSDNENLHKKYKNKAKSINKKQQQKNSKQQIEVGQKLTILHGIF